MPKASVKVMRSYDYCHFEICLGTDDNLTIEQVDDLRKEAARLADKAVAQYKIAKSEASRRADIASERKRLEASVERISQIPESERTAEQKAVVKALDDHEYWERHKYDYDDDDDYDNEY